MIESDKRILVIEDNDLNLKLFKDLLESEGFKVFCTDDGFKALDIINSIIPDLILLDIQLHGISGFDLIKKIKSTHSISNIPVIAVTAFAMRDDEQKVLSSGFEAYITKPISIDSFLCNIRKYLGVKNDVY